MEFPIFEVIEVNGENTHPLFAYLKQAVDAVNLDAIWRENVKVIYEQTIQSVGKSIREFTKFLVDARECCKTLEQLIHN